MTRTRLKRLATRPCAPATPPPVHLPGLDATARAYAAAITEAPWCPGCWLVALPGGDVIVPCGEHDWLEDT
jgi:hypothetical protein